MKPTRTLPPFPLATLAAMVAAASPCATAGDVDAGPNRFSASARFSFNVSAKLAYTGSSSSAANPYYDGFVRPDVSGGAGGRTWNWGYETAGQLAGGGVEMHGVVGTPRSQEADTLKDDPQMGFELSYQRQLGTYELPSERSLVWGGEFAFGKLDLEMKEQGTVNANLTERTDRYSLGGAIPPLAPYNGTFAGPGVLLDLAPSVTSTAAVPVSSTLDASLDTTVYSFKLGPFLEIPVSDKVALEFAGGFAAALVDSDWRVHETVTHLGNNRVLQSFSGDNSESEWVFGFHARGMVLVDFYREMRLFAGMQYQYLQSVEAGGNGRSVSLRLGDGFEAIAGVRISL
jgi:hypothetical protein